MTWLLFLIAEALAGSFLVRGKLSHRFTLEPNQVAGAKLTVENTVASEGTTVTATTMDFVDTDDGTITYKAGSIPHSAGEWLQFAHPVLEIPPGGSAQLEWTVRVPEGTLPGSYWAAVLLSPQELPPENGGPKTVGLSRIQQYAVRVFVEVPGAVPSLSFGTKRLEDKDGRSQLLIPLINDGNYRLRPTLYAEIYDESGKQRKRVDAKQDWIYPETSRPYVLPLEDLPPGRYSMLIIADDRRMDPIGAQYTVELR
jgi:hypothetical protein